MRVFPTDSVTDGSQPEAVIQDAGERKDHHAKAKPDLVNAGLTWICHRPEPGSHLGQRRPSRPAAPIGNRPTPDPPQAASNSAQPATQPGLPNQMPWPDN